MEKKRLVIFGTGSFAEVAHYYLTKDGGHDVVAFTADREAIKETQKFGLPVVAFGEVQEEYPPNEFEMFVAIAYSRQNHARAEKCLEARRKGYHLTTYVCSKAIVWDREKTGSIGTAGCFSFYPTKIITTVEGGAITTDDIEVARKARLLREHGMTKTAWNREQETTWLYDVTDLGYNYRLNDVQASLGMSQLSRIEEINRRRVRAAHEYNRNLEGIAGIRTPYVCENRSHVYHLYVVRIIEQEFGVKRDELFRRLSARGVGLGVHYTPLHLLSYYQKILGYKAGSFPVSERIYNEILSLPLFPTMTRKQISYVTDSLLQEHLQREGGADPPSRTSARGFRLP